MSNVIAFRLKNKPNRNHAMRWLADNIKEFPVNMSVNIGPDIFHGWRFVLGSDEVIYFANCIDRGICKDDFVLRRGFNEKHETNTSPMRVD